MSIDDDKKRENASVENSLMKKIKIKNEFEEELLRKGWVNIMRKNHVKFSWKEKKDNCGEILDVINKNNENIKRKKPTKA